MDIARRIGEIANSTQFTKGEAEIFRLEAGRQVGLDDLSGDCFNAAAKAAGVPPGVLRAYIDHHDQDGSLTPRFRQAWARARRKARAVLTSAGALMLLAVLTTLTTTFEHQNTRPGDVATCHRGEETAIHQPN